MRLLKIQSTTLENWNYYGSYPLVFVLKLFYSMAGCMKEHTAFTTVQNGMLLKVAIFFIDILITKAFVVEMK